MNQSSNNTQQAGKSKVLYLYTGNHGKQTGIKDYISLISSLIKERGIDICISGTLVPNATNLVIDEFTNYVENHKIAWFKKNNPGGKLVFVLTEFVECKWGVETFNFYTGLNTAAFISLLNVYLRLKRDDFRPISPRTLLTAMLFFPILLVNYFTEFLKFLVMRLMGKNSPNPVKKFLIRYHREVYFHMRYLGFRACLPYADAVITSHERISLDFWKGGTIENLGVIYPELDEANVLDNLMMNKELFFEITGSVTKYRRMIINRINRELTVLGLHNVFKYCLAIPFSLSERPLNRGAYSLHPPQLRKWPYSSPTRIFRALAVDNNLPVVTKNFGQNPIEDICFVLEGNQSIIKLYEMYENRNLLLNFISPRIRKYNESAKERNDGLVSRLMALDGKDDY